MGIDKSLTDDFPSVVINGTRYHYGRENQYGQYLVENAHPFCAKDAWCFGAREDMEAFLTCLPESADRDWIVRRFPDWLDVTHEQRGVYMKRRDAHFRRLMEEKQRAGDGDHFNVLRFDDAGWYCVRPDPSDWSFCDEIDVVVSGQEVKPGRRELLIELRPGRRHGEPEMLALKVSRQQALKLAAALTRAALDVEARTEAGHLDAEP